MRGTVLWSFLLLVSLPGVAQQSSSIEQLLRLQPGNYWIYKGTVKWDSSHVGGIIDFSEPNSGQIEHPQGKGSRQVTYKIEVLEKHVHGPVTAYVVRGSFLDLEYYFGVDHEPGLRIWVTYAGRFYVLGADPEFLKHVRSPGDSLVEDINRQTPWLRFPLQQNECPKSVNGEAGHLELFDVARCPAIRRGQPAIVDVPGIVETSVEVWESQREDHEGKGITRLALQVGIIQCDSIDWMLNHEVHVKLVEAHLQ